MKTLPALVLAGGKGTRLRSVVADRPKVLAEVGGRPFLAYLLDQLEAAGVARVVLCVGYMGDRIREEFGSRYGSLSLTYSDETTPLGTGGALRLALSLFTEPTCLVLNGDSYIDSDLGKFLAWHKKKGWAGSLLLAHVGNTARFGTVETNSEGRITRFQEKQGLDTPGWINAGVYLLSRKLLEPLPEKKSISIEQQCFPDWLSLGLGALSGSGTFLDIGTPESFSRAESFLREIKARL